MQSANCGLLENHGVIALGKDLLSAFDRMEVLENAAKQTLMAQSIACCRLSLERLEEIDRFTGRKSRLAVRLFFPHSRKYVRARKECRIFCFSQVEKLEKTAKEGYIIGIIQETIQYRNMNNG